MDRRPRAATAVCHARHVDDDAVLAGEHMRQQSLHAVERAIEIEREGFLHQRIIDLEKFGAADRGAGGIEQELDAAESCDRAFSHVVDLGPLGDVDLDSQRPAALPVDLPSCLPSASLVDVGANDIGSFTCKDQRGGAADPACRTSDDDSLSREIVRCLWHCLHNPTAIVPVAFSAPGFSLAA